jgi:hypothetical protein
LATGLIEVRPDMRLLLLPVAEPFIVVVVKIGLLERALARFSRLESDPESSFSSRMGSG